MLLDIVIGSALLTFGCWIVGRAIPWMLERAAVYRADTRRESTTDAVEEDAGNTARHRRR